MTFPLPVHSTGEIRTFAGLGCLREVPQGILLLPTQDQEGEDGFESHALGGGQVDAIWAFSRHESPSLARKSAAVEGYMPNLRRLIYKTRYLVRNAKVVLTDRGTE